MKNLVCTTVLLLGLLAVAAATATAQEKTVSGSEVPPAVQKMAQEQARGGTIRGFSREREHGKNYYEAETIINGHSRDVLMDSAGNIVEVEEQVDLSAMPDAARSALTARAGHGKIEKVESLTKHGKLVAYEAQVITKGHRSEIQIGPNGERLLHPE
jgi:hypothetical protein